MKYCKYCGRQLEDDANFCTYCGEKQNSDNDKKEDSGYTYTTEYSDYGPRNHNNGNYGKVNIDGPDETKPIKGGALGFVLTFFLNLIGLILCLILGDKKCKKASLITYFVSLAVYVIFIIISVVAVFEFA